MPPQHRHTYIWTADTVYPIIKGFVLSTGRMPTRMDYGRLPVSESTVARVCPDLRQRLRTDGIPEPVMQARLHRWTPDTVYAAVKAFVLKEGRVPHPQDFQSGEHGLPLSHATMYNICPDYKARLTAEGIPFLRQHPIGNRTNHAVRWTHETVYAAIKALVLAEHRLPTLRDYETQAYGLPNNSGTVYRLCPDFKRLLARDGIAYAAAPRRKFGEQHPWRQATAVMVAEAAERTKE